MEHGQVAGQGPGGVEHPWASGATEAVGVDLLTESLAPSGRLHRVQLTLAEAVDSCQVAHPEFKKPLGPDNKLGQANSRHSPDDSKLTR